MNESSFSRIERGVLLQYLQNELPELQICKNNEPFLLLPKKSYVIAQECIAFSVPPENVHSTFSGDVSVHFYYFNRGIFFLSSLLVSKNVASIPLAKEMCKMPERNELQISEFSGDVQFAVSNGTVTIACIAAREFPLFCADMAAASYQNGGTFQSLLQKYVQVEDTLRYPVCAFLSGGKVKNFAVLGRADPLTVLYMSEKIVVFGGMGNNFPFKKSFSCSFTSRIGIRSIKTLCDTNAVFSENDRHCAVCEFTGIKPEDIRFLYEKLYKTVFN